MEIDSESAPIQPYADLDGHIDRSLMTSIASYLKTFYNTISKATSSTESQCALCIMNSKSTPLLTCHYVDGEGQCYNLCADCSRTAIDRRIREMENQV